MGIVFRCQCGKQLDLPAHNAGRRIRCPECATELSVPDVPSPLPFSGPGDRPSRPQSPQEPRTSDSSESAPNEPTAEPRSVWAPGGWREQEPDTAPASPQPESPPVAHRVARCGCGKTLYLSANERLKYCPSCQRELVYFAPSQIPQLPAPEPAPEWQSREGQASDGQASDGQASDESNSSPQPIPDSQTTSSFELPLPDPTTVGPAAAQLDERWRHPTDPQQQSGDSQQPATQANAVKQPGATLSDTGHAEVGQSGPVQSNSPAPLHTPIPATDDTDSTRGILTPPPPPTMTSPPVLTSPAPAERAAVPPEPSITSASTVSNSTSSSSSMNIAVTTAPARTKAGQSLRQSWWLIAVGLLTVCGLSWWLGTRPANLGKSEAGHDRRLFPDPPCQVPVPTVPAAAWKGRSLKPISPTDRRLLAADFANQDNYPAAIVFQHWGIENGLGMYDLARWYAKADNLDASIYWLQRSAREEGVIVDWAQQADAFISLRADRRWPDLTNYLKAASQYWQTSSQRTHQLTLPTGYDSATPLPILVLLHDDASRPDDVLASDQLQQLSDEFTVGIFAISGDLPLGPHHYRWGANISERHKHVTTWLTSPALTDHCKVSKIYLAGRGRGAAAACEIAIHHPQTFHGVLAIDLRGPAPVLPKSPPTLAQLRFGFCGTAKPTKAQATWLEWLQNRAETFMLTDASLQQPLRRLLK